MTSRTSINKRTDSPEEAVAAIRDMLKFRRKDATLFLVIDEVSQYVLANKDRVDRLRAFASALGSGLKLPAIRLPPCHWTSPAHRRHHPTGSHNLVWRDRCFGPINAPDCKGRDSPGLGTTCQITERSTLTHNSP
jgi:hypothetical protein